VVARLTFASSAGNPAFHWEVSMPKYIGRLGGAEIEAHQFKGGFFSAVDTIRAMVPEYRQVDGRFKQAEDEVHVFCPVNDRHIRLKCGFWLVKGPSGALFVFDSYSFGLAFERPGRLQD
jgi:hypothetical protein